MHRIVMTSLFSMGVAAMWLAPLRAAGGLSLQDRKFLYVASKGGTMELRLGQSGLDYGNSGGVKKLAQVLVDDHMKAAAELSQIAGQKGVSLTSEDREMPNGLPALTGDAFDKEFVRTAVKKHERDIKEFEKEASSGSDPELKAWAGKMLPVLHAHLEAAKALSTKAANP